MHALPLLYLVMIKNCDTKCSYLFIVKLQMECCVFQLLCCRWNVVVLVVLTASSFVVLYLSQFSVTALQMKFCLLCFQYMNSVMFMPQDKLLSLDATTCLTMSVNYIRFLYVLS